MVWFGFFVKRLPTLTVLTLTVTLKVKPQGQSTSEKKKIPILIRQIHFKDPNPPHYLKHLAILNSRPNASGRAVDPHSFLADPDLAGFLKC